MSHYQKPPELYEGLRLHQNENTGGCSPRVIDALALAYLRAAIGGPQLEAVVPEPAFEIFRFDTAVAGGRLVQVMPHADFTFALDEVLAAITPATRVVFLTNPNNPTGVSTPLGAIRTIARRVPKETVVFV